MTFSNPELAYLGTQPLGRLATVQSDGSPQVSPVGFSYNQELETIDIGGFNMSRSQKFRNVVHDARVAFVVDDVVSTEPWRVRCLEIRGLAETVPDEGNPEPGHDRSIIRIRPQRIISFGIDQPDQEPHLMTPHNRNVA
jgi:pyridoxamine 5'-phosphate oxidase family protein